MLSLWQGLTWNTHHIDDYIMEATSSVYSASTILRVLQSNEAKMHAILKAWRTNVMFERKEQKVGARAWHVSLVFCTQPRSQLLGLMSRCVRNAALIVAPKKMTLT